MSWLPMKNILFWSPQTHLEIVPTSCQKCPQTWLEISPVVVLKTSSFATTNAAGNVLIFRQNMSDFCHHKQRLEMSWVLVENIQCWSSQTQLGISPDFLLKTPGFVTTNHWRCSDFPPKISSNSLHKHSWISSQKHLLLLPQTLL